MQPAFVPPASYFKLFAKSDLLVIYDCVQLDRRWFTHRQQLRRHDGIKDWMTLPIKKTPRDTTMIKDIQWSDLVEWKWKKESRRFPIPMKPLTDNPCDYIISYLKEYCVKLDIPFNAIKSSSLDVSTDLHGQDRIIAICKEVGATKYINSPGGRNLYDAAVFSSENIELEFLSDWEYSYDSVIERDINEARKEIYEASDYIRNG